MAKRIFQAVVLFFALYAFVFLPLGKKSALEHLRAIWATPAAQQAASEVKGGVKRLVRRLESEARKSAAGSERQLEERDPERGADEREQRAERSGSAERREAEAPRALPKPKQRALSAETPARDGL
jgi:hypothetical protein